MVPPLFHFFKGDFTVKNLFVIGIILIMSFVITNAENPLGNDVGTYELFDPAARITTVGTYGSKVVDRSGFLSGVALWQSAKSSAGSACSTSVVMQEASEAVYGGGLNNMVATTADSLGLRSVADSTYVKVGFVVTQDSARTINSVTLKLRKTGTVTGTNSVTLSIFSDSANGDPSDILVHADAVDSVKISSIAATWGWVTFTFDRPVDLAAATDYHYILTGTYTISTSNYVLVYLETVASGGDVEYEGAAQDWTQVTTSDIVGKILRYNFSNITTAVFDTATHTAGIFDTKDINFRGKKRYVRAKATIIGSSGSFVSSGAITLGEPTVKPVTD